MFLEFLGAFTKLWQATISFVISVGLSVHLEQLGFYVTDFHEICYLRIFQESSDKLQVLLNSFRNKG
jgi:hypothetical protein